MGWGGGRVPAKLTALLMSDQTRQSSDAWGEYKCPACVEQRRPLRRSNVARLSVKKATARPHLFALKTSGTGETMAVLGPGQPSDDQVSTTFRPPKPIAWQQIAIVCHDDRSGCHPHRSQPTS